MAIYMQSVVRNPAATGNSNVIEFDTTHPQIRIIASVYLNAVNVYPNYCVIKVV